MTDIKIDKNWKNSLNELKKNWVEIEEIDGFIKNILIRASKWMTIIIEDIKVKNNISIFPESSEEKINIVYLFMKNITTSKLIIKDVIVEEEINMCRNIDVKFFSVIESDIIFTSRCSWIESDDIDNINIKILKLLSSTLNIKFETDKLIFNIDHVDIDDKSKVFIEDVLSLPSYNLLDIIYVKNGRFQEYDKYTMLYYKSKLSKFKRVLWSFVGYGVRLTNILIFALVIIILFAILLKLIWGYVNWGMLWYKEVVDITNLSLIDLIYISFTSFFGIILPDYTNNILHFSSITNILLVIEEFIGLLLLIVIGAIVTRKIIRF